VTRRDSITPAESERIKAWLATKPIPEVERLSGRSYHTLYRLLVVFRKST